MSFPLPHAIRKCPGSPNDAIKLTLPTNVLVQSNRATRDLSKLWIVLQHDALVYPGWLIWIFLEDSPEYVSAIVRHRLAHQHG